MYDLILKGGTIYDGTGIAPYRADLAVKDGVIAAIAPELTGEAHRVVDVTGLAVAPGFIDVHSHSDHVWLDDDRCESKLYQGVTSEFSGQCGSSIYPCPADKLERIREYAGRSRTDWASGSLQQFMDKVHAAGKKMGTNQIPLIGHGALRCGVMSYDDRRTSPEELQQMCDLLDADMKAGAWGLSLGLGYTPGMFADQQELNALGEVVSRYDGIVTSHLRQQGNHAFTSVQEMINMNLSSGVHVHVVHIKLSGKRQHGNADELASFILKAREGGVNITADMYPYEASSTGFANILPKWALEGGKAAALRRIRGPERAKLLEILQQQFKTRADGDRIYIVHTAGKLPEADDKTVWEAAEALGMSMAEAALHILDKSECHANSITYSMDPRDVDYFLHQNWIAIGSDGRAFPLDPALNKGKPHPRNFGTFPKVLRLAREQGICSMEMAVRRMTGLCADIIGMTDRGYLREGLVADITVFDPATVTDNATYKDPFAKPTGICHVLMEGQFALENGLQTDARLGKFILKK